MQSIKPPQNVPQDRAAPAHPNPLAPDHGRRVSKEEYWARWYENPYPDLDVSYEWNNGILEAKPLPDYPQIMLYRWFSQLLGHFLEVNPIAKVIDLETGVSMTILDVDEPSGKWEVVYKPDLGIVLNDNPASWGASGQRAYEGICDLIVEAVSDSTQAEARRDTEEKRSGYARAGVQEYFILDPSDRHMHFLRLTSDGRYIEIQPDAAGVIHSHVLPGFRFRRADLLRKPGQKALSLDEVYADYVTPGHLDSVHRAESAEEQAAAEAAARRQAEERAERAEQQAAAEAAARRQAEEQAKRAEEENQALQAELARLRRQRP